MTVEELPYAAANEAWLNDNQAELAAQRARDEAERLRAEFQELAAQPCTTGKHKHATKAEALAQIGSLQANRQPARTSAFLCGYCNFWHVGRR